MLVISGRQVETGTKGTFLICLFGSALIYREKNVKLGKLYLLTKFLIVSLEKDVIYMIKYYSG